MVLRDGAARPRARPRALTPGGGLASPAARAFLEALGLEPRLLDARFLEDVFLRFQRRVACETLTRAVGDPERFDAEEFAGTWPDEERGLTGEERALLFAWFAGELGFTCELVDSLCSRPWGARERGGERLGTGSGGSSSKVNGAEAHRTAVATIEGGRILADAGFPLPVLVPLDSPSKEIPSSLGMLGVAPAAEGRAAGAGLRVTCDARGEVTDLLHVNPGARPESLPLEEIRRPSPGGGTQLGAGGSKNVFALRVLDDRVLHWSGGVMTILDAWSVLCYPLPGTARAAFESLFALNLEGVDLPGVPAAAVAPSLTVFHAVALSPDEVRRGLDRSTPPLSPLVVSREAVVEAVSGGTRIALRAMLGGDVPPAGPGESARKTLVFHLAMDLLALGRA